MTSSESASQYLEIATLGGGCFWCTEAIYQQLHGVQNVVSGYAGGHVSNPSYREVCGGNTGHAEVIQIQFDPKQISYEQVLEVFFKTHDPTTPNRQGNDVGSQYRSVIFYHTPQQRQTAEEVAERLDQSGAFAAPIVTEITPFSNFFPAEDFHQDYFSLHGREPYCQLVIHPKLEKFRHAFPGQLKQH